MSEWLLCCAKWSSFQLYHGVYKLQWMSWCPIDTRPTCCPWIDMPLHSGTLSWFRTNQSLIILLNWYCTLIREAAYTYFITYAMFEPAIYKHSRRARCTITRPMRYYFCWKKNDSFNSIIDLTYYHIQKHKSSCLRLIKCLP